VFHSSVSVVTGLCAWSPRNHTSIPSRCKRFLFLCESFQDGHGAHPVSLFNDFWLNRCDLSSGVKWLGCETDHSPFDVEDRNAWSYTFTPPCGFMSFTVTSLPLNSTFSLCIKLTLAECDTWWGSQCMRHTWEREKCIQKFGRKAWRVGTSWKT
jgi:hypothetical protein